MNTLFPANTWLAFVLRKLKLILWLLCCSLGLMFWDG